jgi:hypothetical protein
MPDTRPGTEALLEEMNLPAMDGVFRFVSPGTTKINGWLDPFMSPKIPGQ